MWVRAGAEISENVIQLTTACSTHFFVFGEQTSLVDAGLAATATQLISAVKEYLPPGDSLQLLFLTHAHFDHLGGVAAIVEAFPEIRIIGSFTFAEVIAREGVLQEAYDLNKQAAEALSLPFAYSFEEWSAPFTRIEVLADGDVIDLGADVEVKLIACPGHTEECTAFYVLPDGALVGGESFGDYAGRGKVIPSFGYSYRLYTKSLEKVSQLEIRSLGFPHSGALTGDLPQRFLFEVRTEADKFFSAVEERLSQGELVDEICADLLQQWIYDVVSPEGPFIHSQRGLLRQMVLAVAADMQAVSVQV